MQPARCACDDPSCEVGSYLRKLAIARVKLEMGTPAPVAVKTWCRICGLPVLVNVVQDYDYAVRHLSALDDAPMVHKNRHAEIGNWGIHWRLDDVLRIVFPAEHQYDIWPKPAWYEESMAEDLPVELLEHKEAAPYREELLRRLEESIEAEPLQRIDLESYGDVWDENEFSSQFEHLGYRPPFVLVKDWKTGEQGTVLFQNYPRLYFGYDRHRVI